MDTEIIYFRNNRTGKIFISIDGGDTLINPSGKTIPYNPMFEEVDDAPLTVEQQEIVDKVKSGSNNL